MAKRPRTVEAVIRIQKGQTHATCTECGVHVMVPETGEDARKAVLLELREHCGMGEQNVYVGVK